MGAIRRRGAIEWRRDVRHKAALILERMQDAARDDRIPTIGERPIDLAIEDAVAAVDEPRGIAVRTRLDGDVARVAIGVVGAGQAVTRVRPTPRGPPADEVQFRGSARRPRASDRPCVRVSMRTVRAICRRR